MSALELGPELFRFESHASWVNHASRAWAKHSIAVNDTLCIDAKGRHCFIGRDFRIAHEDGAFPVTVHLRRADLRAAA